MPLLIFVYFTQYLDKVSSRHTTPSAIRCASCRQSETIFGYMLIPGKNILSYASIMGFPVTGIHYNDVAQAFYMGFLIWM